MLTIGIDVGGTSIKSALISVGNPQDASSYKVEKIMSVPTQGNTNADTIIGNICKAIMLYDYEKCDKIAVASAGTIDWDSGRVTFATDALMGFGGTKLSEILSAKFGRQIVAINDAVSAIIGEKFCGSGKKYDKILMFTLGTGLGASFLADKKLNNASVIDTHLGHAELHHNGRKCFCGKNGCAEQYVSATALKKNGRCVNIEKIFKSDKERYQEARERFYQDFLRVIDLGIEEYSPNAIIVGGGVVELKALWWADFVAEYNKIARPPILTAELGNKAGALGAVFSAYNGVFLREKK